MEGMEEGREGSGGDTEEGPEERTQEGREEKVTQILFFCEKAIEEETQNKTVNKKKTTEETIKYSIVTTIFRRCKSTE